MNKKHLSQEPDQNHPVYTLRIASQLSGIPPHSIRQYIDKGLLLPFKLDTKHHLFSMNDVARLKQIHSLIKDSGLNMAGIKALMATIPCWAIRQCSEQVKHSCKAYHMNSIPCWEASEKQRFCRNEQCRDCGVYTGICETGDVKSLIQTFV